MPSGSICQYGSLLVHSSIFRYVSCLFFLSVMSTSAVSLKGLPNVERLEGAYKMIICGLRSHVMAHISA
jgi:hypothetical protein